LYDYAYLKESIEPVSCTGLTVRELTAEDENATEAFSKHGFPVVAGIFKQKFRHGNNDTTRLLGMFNGERLAGCAAITFEQARSIRISDAGSRFFLKEHDTAENRAALRSYAIGLALREGYLPVDGGAPYDNGENERLGYTLISKRYSFLHA
jgi:hypothetical protein